MPSDFVFVAGLPFPLASHASVPGAAAPHANASNPLADAIHDFMSGLSDPRIDWQTWSTKAGQLQQALRALPPDQRRAEELALVERLLASWPQGRHALTALTHVGGVRANSLFLEFAHRLDLADSPLAVRCGLANLYRLAISCTPSRDVKVVTSAMMTLGTDEKFAPDSDEGRLVHSLTQLLRNSEGRDLPAIALEPLDTAEFAQAVIAGNRIETLNHPHLYPNSRYDCTDDKIRDWCTAILSQAKTVNSVCVQRQAEDRLRAAAKSLRTYQIGCDRGEHEQDVEWAKVIESFLLDPKLAAAGKHSAQTH